MSKTSDKQDTPTTPPERSTVILLLGDIADITWRMFVPALIGIVGGYTLDNTFNTKPWLFILGTVIGCIGAGILIKQLLQKKI